ncbi:arylesterase [Sphingomicrobium clamense]|uniref:Arylesterase n=1 Tax=Sphingomicrobium clamense TaxID=2851013 RepID=A0ABS6V2F9_9SPHN|nr:arylesterase [Sphingomicrobium sp. B8]MBW0143755.1 arylesterase [Sphingomicrobium sp. B8]
MSIRFLSHLVALLTLFSASAHAQPVERPTIMAFGDSLTAGYNLPEGLGFAPQLEDALRREGVAATVIDAGVSGETTSGGRERIEWVLDGLEKKPDLFILELGGNDMLRVIDPALTEANLRAMLDVLAERDIDVLLAGMQAAPNYDPAFVEAFNAIYPRLAAYYDVPLYPLFVDGVAGEPDKLLPDGIHPNFEGIKVMVTRILPSVRQSLEN